MESNSGQEIEQVQASYNETQAFSNVIVGALQQADAPIGYGVLACLMTIARLAHPYEDPLSPEEEVEFIQDLSEYLAAYWPDPDVQFN